MDEARHLYDQIAKRTAGSIYIGVVGPVRTGKSTFIKRFMGQLVRPNLENTYQRDRARDELPQSGSGRTIMTTEPKFVPEQAVEISPDGTSRLKVRLIDSVGYLVPGAMGAEEEGTPRMVMTPWSQTELPLEQAAEIGTKKVMEEKDPSQAAVASRTAGELYGMEILAEEINNVKGNTTRFLILGKEPVYAKTAGKISVAFEIPHKSGSLYNILGNFIFNNVNMTMIESRPIPEKSFEYRFFVDFEGNLSNAGVRNALTGLAAEASVMRILGNY